MYLLPDSLFCITEQTYGHRLRKNHIIHNGQRMFGITTNKFLRKDTAKSIIGKQRTQTDIGHPLSTANIRFGIETGGGFGSRKLFTKFRHQRFLNHFIHFARLLFHSIDTVNIFGIGIETVVSRFVTHPIECRHETGKTKRQTENTGQRLCFVFPHIAESDFQIKYKHGST